MMLRKKITLCVLILSILQLTCYSQSQKYKGYPVQDPKLDVLPGFVNPPKGYGNVPFYWWNGDTLQKERLAEQLEILSASATDGFAVSYIHTDPHVDTLENKAGHGLFGRTEPGVPPVFSEEWREIWNWFSGECGRRGLGVGLDDYTVGWVGNGFYPDELDNMPVFKGYQGELDIQVDTVKGGTAYSADIPNNLLTVVAWPGKIDLTKHIKNNKLQWQTPKNKEYKVYLITTKPGYVIHPEHGKRLVDVYFNRFESNMNAEQRKGMNYFFQDELSYPINQHSWSDDFQAEFSKRKGYDITPYLPALKEYIGEITPKIRMDYCEVLMDLSEERYYKPIYNWHADRGLIYGCDNLSRGKDPIAYIDYFRAMSWFTAPGNDAPSRGSSFLETKVSSSIAHVYKRPRTWLEAFHSMGWGSSGEWLTQQIDHHFMAGGNLVCMHGLYYSTHGGWWEWAPPDFHFRMPYWPHMKQWLKYTERMSYLLSQGSHVCDIAILYPTESLQAYPDANPDITFQTALQLSNSGLDYDFIDFRSLREANTSQGALTIAGETYKIIVLADIKAIDYAALQKIRDFYRSGGIVLATGSLPQASNNKGENDPEVHKIVKEIFGANSRGRHITDGSLEKQIPELITPDFLPEKRVGKVLHRKIGERDVYMVTDVEKNTACFFRSKGKVELWDANSGKTEDYPIIRQTDSGTYLRMDKESTNSYLVVFSPGSPTYQQEVADTSGPVHQISLDNEWEVELLPTLQNKWGDYRFPAFDGFIGAEARMFRYEPSASSDLAWTEPTFNDSSWQEDIYGFGPQVETRTVQDDTWSPLSFSWQYGVWDNPGAQGYHGLKGKVSDGFFILDIGGEHQFRTYTYADKPGVYRIVTDGVQPDYIQINEKEEKGKVYLEAGWHSLLVGYKETKQTDYKSQTGAFHDDRERSFVVLYPEDTPLSDKPALYATQVSSRWYDSEHLVFDPYGGKHDTWNFRFATVPGLEEITFTLYGKDLKVWVDGEEIPQANIQLTGSFGKASQYRVSVGEKKLRSGFVAFSVKPERGYQGAAIIKEPVQLKTGQGLMKPGDWSEEGALHYYSGGMYYRTTCHLPQGATNNTVRLNLGTVVATCEVKINNKSVGILISPPYELDITPYVTEGENHIEVLVYSTLSNHYQTTPTPYRGDPKAGLIGPVKILIGNATTDNPKPSANLLNEKWSAHWINSANASQYDYGVFHFRKSISLDSKPSSFVINISADNRYRLFVNGKAVCWGPARGDIAHWYYETVDIAPYMKEGKNTLAVAVWNFSPYTPGAQMTLKTGLIIQGNTSKEEVVNTDSSWKVFTNKAYKPSLEYLQDVGAAEIVDAAAYPWGWEQTNYPDADWENARVTDRGQPYGLGTGYAWILYPRDIPMMEESLERMVRIRRSEGVTIPDSFLKGTSPVTVAPNQKVSFLIDQSYLTNAYPELIVSGGKGSSVRLTYSEALYKEGQKGNRNETDGYSMRGFVDVFYPDGGANRLFRPLWFRTYRYVQVEVETGNEPLTLKDLYGIYTAYPFKENGSFESNDASLSDIWEVGWRTARLCAHETYFDCPYYEQLQYVGDTRIQALISLYVDGDDRLMRKAINVYNWSRTFEGITTSRYPARMDQFIPPFSLYWINMVHDYWMHRYDPAFIQSCIPTVKTILEWFADKVDPQTGILGGVPHWNFVDWPKEWPWDNEKPLGGVPPGAITGGSAVLSLQLAYTLKDAMELLNEFGEQEMATRYNTLYQSLCKNVWEKCWDKERGLLFDDLKQTSYSQHVNIMGILSDAVPANLQKEVFERLDSDPSLIQATFYYRFYLFRALKKIGEAEKYTSMLKPWFDMLDMGLTTFAENPEPTRSDCHAWSSSPVYDFLATVCGVEPAEPGFRSVSIKPHPGRLTHIKGKIPHPKGLIEVDLKKNKNSLTGSISLPQGLSGSYSYEGKQVNLKSGKNEIR